MNECFIVAGPPRSGTSLIAGVLHKLGICMGVESEFLRANANNPSGYYEDSQMVFLNDAILEAAGGTVWTPPPQDRIGQAASQYLDRLKFLLDKRSENGKWGWKDPRNCLTLEAYLPHCNPKVIICYRNMDDTARSILSLNTGINNKEAFDLATEYYDRLITTVRNHDLPHLILYHEITLGEPDEAITALLKFCGAERDFNMIQNAKEFIHR